MVNQEKKLKANSLSPHKVRMPERKFEDQRIESSTGLTLIENATNKKSSVGKVSPKNPGFRALRINVTKGETMKSSTASVSVVESKPETIVDVKVLGPLTSQDEQNAHMKAKPPLPNLPAFSVTAIILSLLGYADEVDAILK